MKRAQVIAAGIVFLCGLAASHVAAATVTVFGAASLADSLKKISAAYERETRDRIIFNFAASSVLARQIEEGAPADVFFSADEAKMDRLEKEGLIQGETRVSLLSNALVIVVAAGEGVPIRAPKDLASRGVKRVALAEPATVPAGVYAKEYLQKINLWTAVEGKVVPTENVRAALAAVEAGNAEAGIVYKTDAAISGKVRVAYEVPPSESPVIRYSVAVLKESRKTEPARRFVNYLAGSREAAAIFVKFGFVVRK